MKTCQASKSALLIRVILWITNFVHYQNLRQKRW